MSVGLVQNIVESASISTVAMVLKRDYSEMIGIPRGVHVRFPLGNPLGEAGKPDQQRKILKKALETMVEIKNPGTIVTLPFLWRRM